MVIQVSIVYIEVAPAHTLAASAVCPQRPYHQCPQSLQGSAGEEARVLGFLPSSLVVPPDHVLPGNPLCRAAFTAKLVASVLVVGDVRLAPSMGSGVFGAPPGNDPPEMATG
jgi:hypothetical protein